MYSREQKQGMEITKILNDELVISRDRTTIDLFDGPPTNHTMSDPLTQAQPEDFPRPLRRRAANRARYDLAAAWTPLNQYLIEDGDEEADDGSPESGVDRDNESEVQTRQARIARLASRKLDQSEEDSDSDEYKEEESDGSQKWGWKRRRSSGEDVGNRRKKPRQSVAAKKATASKISKVDMRALVDYVSQKLQWEEAASFITMTRRQGQNKMGHTGKDRKATSVVTGRVQATSSGNSGFAIDLKEHWKEILGKKIVAMYKK